MRVPAGFETRDLPGAIIAARPGGAGFVEEAVRRSGTLYGFAQSAGGTGMRGRTTAWTLRAPDGDWVVRHYTRGGAVAPLLGDRYCRLATPRPVRESATSDRARALGVATPEVRAFVVYPGVAFQRADIATARIPGARDLADLSLGDDRPDEAERIEAWRATGRLLRAAFATGVIHPDLNLRNILVSRTEGAAIAHLLDLDGARIAARASPRHVHMMLQRLHRSRLKLEARSGRAVGDTALAAFQEALDG